LGARILLFDITASLQTVAMLSTTYRLTFSHYQITDEFIG